MRYFRSVPFFITAGILIFVGIVGYFFRNHYKIDHDNPSNIKIVRQWDLPRIMEEISGIDYLKDGRIACIQDEDGKIFIYNLDSKEIDRTIDFAEKGDFEGIAVVGQKAFVLRSDGVLFEVADIRAENPEVTQHDTPLTEDRNVEGLCYDKANNRLLLAIKDREEDKNADYKGIYEYNLKTNEFNSEPVYKLKFNDPIFADLNDIGTSKVFRPSEINIQPKTGEIYLLDAEVPKMLILSKDWKPKALYVFDINDFPQPEGLTFSPEARMFISNEGVWHPGNILEVDIKNRKKEKTKNQ